MLDFVRDPRAVRLQLVSGAGHHDAVVRPLLEAQVSVWIATANLKAMMIAPPRGLGRRGQRYRSVVAALAELAARRVELRVLHAELPSRPFREEFDRHPELVQGGIELRQCPRLHLKTVIVDGRLLYLGSANWTGAGLGAKQPERRNFELGLVSEDAALLDEVQQIYDHLWRGGACPACGRRDVCPAPLDAV